MSSTLRIITKKPEAQTSSFPIRLQIAGWQPAVRRYLPDLTNLLADHLGALFAAEGGGEFGHV